MPRFCRPGACAAALAGLLLVGSTAHADTFQGTLYYTRFSGTPNVTSLAFSYNDASHALTYGTQNNLASLNGADGIMFAPNGDLLVTSNSVGNVYRLNASNGNLLQTVSTGGPPDFHMALDPTGTKFYSSDRYTRGTGPLDTFAIDANGTIHNATTTAITGGDTNVTQLAFAPNGKILYTDGTPNRLGSIGLFNFGSPDTTTQLIPANQVNAAHGVVYDPFTGLWTMFGGGSVATLDPNGATNADIIASLKQRNGINADFDQGSVDGFGHALIAGNGQITFIDYSQTHDITSAANTIIIRSVDGAGNGFGALDDVAPLVGLGSQTSTPEPASVVLLATGGLGLLAVRLRRRRLAAAQNPLG
jgi:hypothetical protein